MVVPPIKNLSKQKSLTDRQQVSSRSLINRHCAHSGMFFFNCSPFTLSQENHDVLIKSLAEDRRYDDRRPAAACIVYKSLLHWHSFEAEKTNIFDRIIHTIRSSIEVVILINAHTFFPLQWQKLITWAHLQNAESFGELAYWLSTTSTLLYLLQNTLKASSSSSKGSNRSRTTTGNLFSIMVQVSSLQTFAMHK